MSGPWRIAKRDGDVIIVDPADTFDGYRQAKREAMLRNEKRRFPRPCWVILTPAGDVCKSDAEASRA